MYGNLFSKIYQGFTRLAAVWLAKRVATSSKLKTASPVRVRMVMMSNGSGTSRSGDGGTAGGRPTKKLRRGTPGQSLIPTAPANWMLDVVNLSVC